MTCGSYSTLCLLLVACANYTQNAQASHLTVLSLVQPELRHGSIGGASELASPAASVAPAFAPAQPTAVEQASDLCCPKLVHDVEA